MTAEISKLSFILYITSQGRQTGGGVATPPDFERTCCLIAYIGPF